MKRTLTLSVLLSLSAANPVALALGLGDAQVDSPIGYPLRATVPLLAAPADMDPDRVNVTIASAGTFEAVGMTLTPVVDSVRAEVKRRNDALVLDLSSQSPVNEPWLDLLFEFQTPDGKREVRELTLLLDPPGYSSRSTLVRTAGQSTAASRVASAEAGSLSSAAVPGPVISSSRSQAEAAVVPASGGVASTVIRKGDTLWSLAEEMRPSRDLTIEQTIVALVKANPQAFPTGNANVMKAGATLSLPSQDVLTAQTHGDSVRQLSIMERSWTSSGASRPAQARATSGSGNAADAAALAEDARAALVRQSDVQTDADVARLLASGSEGLQVQVAPSVLNAVLDSGESEEVDRPRGLGQLEELEQKWQENQRVLSANRAERDALRDEVANLRHQITRLRVQVERLVAHQENKGLMPTLSNIYEGVLERPLVLGGSALAALLFLLALGRRRPRETDGLKHEAPGISPGRDSSVSDNAAGAAVPSDDFDARVRQMSVAGRAGKTDEQKAAAFEVSELPDEQEPAAEKSEDSAASESAIIDYQPVKVDTSGVTGSSSDSDAAGKSNEPFKQSGVSFSPQPAANETRVAKVVPPLREPSSSNQSAFPEGVEVEVVEYPLQDASTSASADEKKTPQSGS